MMEDQRVKLLVARIQGQKWGSVTKWIINREQVARKQQEDKLKLQKNI